MINGLVNHKIGFKTKQYELYPNLDKVINMRKKRKKRNVRKRNNTSSVIKDEQESLLVRVLIIILLIGGLIIIIFTPTQGYDSWIGKPIWWK